MSSRNLKKIKAADEINDLKKSIVGLKSEEDDDDHLTEEVAQRKSKSKKNKPARNKFALLNLEEDHDLHSEEEEKFTHDKDFSSTSQPENQAKVSNSAKKKKKKKQKKKQSLTDNKENEKSNEDEIDQSLREINLMYGISPSTQTQASSSNSNVSDNVLKPLLGVERRHLNADNEMKRRFGSDVVHGERGRRNQHTNSYKPRSTWMVSARQEWTAIGKSGISMKLNQNDNSVMDFCYEHSSSYQQIQFQFYDAVESMDPENIASLLQHHPYHIDSLLQLSEICKTNEDYQEAARLIERTLYILEISMHTLFNVAQGNCRLKYKQAENRSLFLALFRHLNTIALRGCYRTALEFCKLLLSLDPDEDPLCVLLMIDYFALKASEYQYLIRLYHAWQDYKNLAQLPNFAYSIAMAMFFQKNDRADEQLQFALMAFPGCLVPLTEKCEIKLDDSLSKHTFFSSPLTEDNDALQQLIRLFIGRNVSLWKGEEVVNWLVTNAEIVLQRLNTEPEKIEEYTKLRKSRYRGTPRNIFRHIMISEIPYAVRVLPPDVTSQPLLSHDPLPPVDSVCGYVRPLRRRANQSEGDLFSLFFRSLLPTFAQGNNRNPDAYNNNAVRNLADGIEDPVVDIAEDAEAVQANVDNLRRRAGQVIGAMQSLLNSLSYRGDLIENDPNQNQDDEDGDWE